MVYIVVIIISVTISQAIENDLKWLKVTCVKVT